MPPKSTIWKYFSKTSEKAAMCSTCMKSLKTSGNTSNLIGHLKAKHEEIYSKYFDSTSSVTSSKNKGRSKQLISNTQLVPSTSTQEKNMPNPHLSVEDNPEDPKRYQKTIKESFSSIAAFRDGGDMHNRITHSIVYMICRDSQPISIVENEGFKHVLKVTAPLYKIPSRRTIDSLIDEKYEAVASFVKEQLKSVTNVCITTDIWTETHQTISFLGITVHFIENWHLESIVLGVYELRENHTAEHLADHLTKTSVDWGLNAENIVAVVTDGGSNMVSAVGKAFGNKKHSYCFAHMLNLMAQKSYDSLAEVTAVIDKVKCLVNWFKQSVVASDELRKKTQLRLIQSVITRWNSTFYMVERFLSLREIVAGIANFNTSAPPMPSAGDIEFLHEFLALFKPIEFATTQASGETFVMSSIVIPIVRMMGNKINFVSCRSELGKKLKEGILGQYKKRFGGVENSHFFAMACLLDPRFKNLHFQDKALLGTWIRKLNQEILVEGESSDSDTGQSSPVPSSSRDNDFWEDHHKMVEDNWNTRKRSRLLGDFNTGSLQPELSVYLKNPVLKLKDDPLKFYGENNSLIAKVANKYLCVTATSVPSERVFSITGNIVSEKRSRLKKEKINKLLFLQTANQKFWGLG